MSDLESNIIENAGIFTNDFKPFVRNNAINLPSTEEIVAIYGPNGTGKTSLIKVLSDSKGTKIKFKFNGNEYNSGSAVFHVINDQNNRNIILGETKELFLGDDIKREFELQKFLEESRTAIISDIISKLKSNHNISAASNPLIPLIKKKEIVDLIKDIANNKSKGLKFETSTIIAILSSISPVDFEWFFRIHGMRY